MSVKKLVESNESPMRVLGAPRRRGKGVSMWTNENRSKYNRDHLRYPSDLTDDELEVIKHRFRQLGAVVASEPQICVR